MPRFDPSCACCWDTEPPETADENGIWSECGHYYHKKCWWDPRAVRFRRENTWCQACNDRVTPFIPVTPVPPRPMNEMEIDESLPVTTDLTGRSRSPSPAPAYPAGMPGPITPSSISHTFFAPPMLPLLPPRNGRSRSRSPTPTFSGFSLSDTSRSPSPATRPAPAAFGSAARPAFGAAPTPPSTPSTPRSTTSDAIPECAFCSFPGIIPDRIFEHLCKRHWNDNYDPDTLLKKQLRNETKKRKREVYQTKAKAKAFKKIATNSDKVREAIPAARAELAVSRTEAQQSVEALKAMQ